MAADPQTILHNRLADAIRRAFADKLPGDPAPMLAPATNPKFGDFQSNAAMPLAKALGEKPRDVAQQILEHAELADVADEPEIAGPGFINIRLKPAALEAALEALDTPALGVAPPGPADALTVVVDLCGVNLAKQMHVGHIRATVIGDALARAYERLGHHVVRQNHFGDWGLPIAMVTEAVRELSARGELDLDTLTLDHLEHLYRRAQTDAAPDRAGLAAVRRFGLGPKAAAELEEQVAGAEDALAKSKAALVKLQTGDPDYARVWKRISEITLRACFDNCARLQATVTDDATAGESTYRDELGPVIEALQNVGVAEENQGALIVRLDDAGVKEPLLVRKSDGGFLYATTDLAAIRRRVQKLGADRVIYAVDARQSLHFRQVFAAAHKAGFTKKPDGSVATLTHAAFGTVLGEDNRPFKTRGGENVKLADLLAEAVDRADAAVAQKNPDLDPTERRAIAEAVGIGAIKYADLAADRVRDYVFSFDRMLAFEGATGPYLQYALVRIRSIFRRAAERLGIDASGDLGPFRAAAPQEKQLALALLRYPETLAATAEHAEPHRLCQYLFELATAFSAFFEACPVLRADTDAERNARLRLARLTGRVLEDGLRVLGIEPLERM